LSARKRRPRRNPPRGQLGGGAPSEAQQQQAHDAADAQQKCALLERSPGYAPQPAHGDDEDSGASSR
jgi:hypothetical protein